MLGEISNSRECCVETGPGAEAKTLQIRQEYEYYDFDAYPSEELYANAATGTASDLGDIAAAGYQYTYSNPSPDSFNQDTIDRFNEQVAPSLEAGSSLDHSRDGDIGIKVDPFSERYGGRTGVLVGDKDFKAGIYKNPLEPNEPGMFAVEAGWKE